MAIAGPTAARAQTALPLFSDAICQPRLTRVFAPPVPSGSTVEYLVCRSSRTLDALRPDDWATHDVTVDEALPGVSPEVHRALVLLYGGRRVRVARGWIASVDGLDSIALIAPPPADALDRITSGTLIVRTRIPRRRLEGSGL